VLEQQWCKPANTMRDARTLYQADTLKGARVFGPVILQQFKSAFSTVEISVEHLLAKTEQ
jgi:hypothetical protein